MRKRRAVLHGLYLSSGMTAGSHCEFPMKTILAALLISVAAGHACLAATRLVEPKLRLENQEKGAPPRVALTFDACSGKTDERILSTLIDNRIPATIFVTARFGRVLVGGPRS